MKNTNFKTSVRFLSVTLGLLFIVCAGNLSVAQAQIAYSGYARAVEGQQNGTPFSVYETVLPATGGALNLTAPVGFFSLANMTGCVGAAQCNPANANPGSPGVVLMVNGAAGASNSTAKVDYIGEPLNFYGVTFLADWLVSMTNAACAGAGASAGSSGSLRYLYINGQLQFATGTTNVDIPGYQLYTRPGTGGSTIKIETNVATSNAVGANAEATRCALVLTNLTNGDQLRLGCSHADVRCLGGGTTCPPPGPGACQGACSFSQGYYKNHEETVAQTLQQYPNVAGFTTNGKLILGNASYTAAQIDALLETPPRGNILIQLAHQLAAAKLNLLRNQNCVAPTDPIRATITAADALLSANSTTNANAVKNALDSFNNGGGSLPHCDD